MHVDYYLRERRKRIGMNEANLFPSLVLESERREAVFQSQGGFPPWRVQIQEDYVGDRAFL
jgi:hypothetical protein